MKDELEKWCETHDPQNCPSCQAERDIINWLDDKETEGEKEMEDMDKPKLEIGDIVQIDPEFDEIYGACLMIVTEPKSWGAQGYITIPGKGNAFLRCRFENMEKVGHCAWIRDNDKGKENL